MGFILKTNNRKVESGTTLRAKVISPDKTAYDYKDFPIIVQPQSLSDKEKLLRDYQTVASILDSNNPDWIITKEVYGINEAIKAVTYSSVVFGDAVNNTSDSLIDNGTSGNVTIIEANNGKVVNRPAYNATTTHNFSAVLNLTLTIGSGNKEEKMLFTRIVVVPPYSKEEILEAISTKWTATTLWDSIKKNNVSKERVYSSLNQPTGISLLQTWELDHMIDTEDENSVPVLSWVYPSYLNTTLISSDGTIGTLDADDVYQVNRESCNVTPVYLNELSDSECTGLSLDQTKSKGEVVAYKLSSKTASENKVIGRWSFGATRIEKSIDISFLSQKVDMQLVYNNVKGSFSLGWIIPQDILEEYGQEDMVIPSNNDRDHKLSITIPADKHLILKLSNNIRNVVTTNTNAIADTNHIGYAYDGRTMEGFSSDMFGTFNINSTVNMHSTDTTISVDDVDLPSDATTGTDFNSSNITQYIYLSKDELTSVDVTFTLNFTQNAISSTPGNIPVYLTFRTATT